jgi:multidrug resistance efflux pump
VAVGATILGAFFGRKATSVATVSRAATALRTATRVGAERQQAAQADESVAAVQQQIDALQAQGAAAIAELKARLDPAALPLESLAIAPRKGDISVGELVAAWVPMPAA